MTTSRLNLHRLYPIVAVDVHLAEHMLADFDVGSFVSIYLYEDGLVNSNYDVVTTQGRFVLRIYADRDEGDISFEGSILEHLSSCNVPCQRFVASKHGGYVRPIGDKKCVLLTYIPGASLRHTHITQGTAHAVGKMVGKMHNGLGHMIAATTKPYAGLENIRGIFTRSMHDVEAAGRNSTIIELLWRTLKSVERQLDDKREWNCSIVHGDIAPDNVISCEGAPLTLIDYEDAYYGRTLDDLALTLVEFAFKAPQSLDSDLVYEILRGYLTERPISSDEAAMLPPLMTLLCFKFLGYTLAVHQRSGQHLGQSPYILRIVALSSIKAQRTLSDAINRARDV